MLLKMITQSMQIVNDLMVSYLTDKLIIFFFSIFSYPTSTQIFGTVASYVFTVVQLELALKNTEAG
jgi:hypothetical protein